MTNVAEDASPVKESSTQAGQQPRRLWLLGLIALVTLGGVAWSLSRRSSAAPAEVATGTPVLLDFGMDICAQCKKTQAMLERVRPSYEGRVKIRFLDVRDDANEALGAKYGMRIIPLLVMLDSNGREVWRHEGVPDEAKLKSQLDSVAGDGAENGPICPEETGACSP